MASAIQVPIDVYLRTLDHEPDCEYVDGLIDERPAGQFDYASWQQAFDRSRPNEQILTHPPISVEFLDD